MAERSPAPRGRVGDMFKKHMANYRKTWTYRDPDSQKALEDYEWYPEKSQRTTEYKKLSYLERVLYDDARRSNATRLQRWRLKKSLGEGAYGDVTMWERYMGPDQEPLRLACKQTFFDSWFLDVCEEANATYRVNDLGCANVVKVIDWVVNQDQEESRIQYEYCPHGTLLDFTKYYHSHCLVTMPEAMIWHIFHSLATTLCYHAHGTTAEEAIAGWEEIIHRDIKPLNILMAEPDPNNRPLYPTLKLADYGLAYPIPNENVRNLKITLPGGGTVPYAAPEVMATVRMDPTQTPHEKVYCETDLFSVGCIILEIMRRSNYLYHEYSMTLIDYGFPMPYKSFPYSEILMDLAMDCVARDVRSRPRVRDVYKRTKYYADLWYSKISGPDVGKPQEAYAGQVLWNKELRNLFETNMDFRWNYTIHNDWFYNHPGSVAKLYRTATDPGKANVPRGDIVAIGNGLAHQHELSGEGLDSWPMTVFNREGKILKRRDGKAIRRMFRPQLEPPKLDEEWKGKRAELLRKLIHSLSRRSALTGAEKKMLIRHARELVAVQFDSPTRETLRRIETFRMIAQTTHIGSFDPVVCKLMQDFANETERYLLCITATKPRYTPPMTSINLPL